jgi:hypothetical protein
MCDIEICIRGDDPAVRFAARELARYLKRATGRRIGLLGARDSKAAVFRLGICEDVGIARPKGLEAEDDWLRIQPDGAGYILTGANGRSVLFAVYRYLGELGFRWLRPGARGEVIPSLTSPVRKGLCIDERPACRYRTLCLEGAASKEHVRDLIDWGAKQRMNGYFIQFEFGLCFFRRWYEHADNPDLKAEAIDPAAARAMAEDIIGEIKRRGLRFERVGHGWTCDVLGLPGEGWDAAAQAPAGSRKGWLARIGGKRRLFHGVPINTNLCYGRPEVRKAMTDAIVAYAIAHPEVDALHFWLADGMNNHCECDACRKARPADFYVDMLNELDGKLAAAGLRTRVVFLVYVDLLWPPARNRIKNPDRFMLMFAPITRSYLSSFAEVEPEPMTAYARNQLRFPGNAGENAAYLRGWQRHFRGVGVAYEYHILWACFYDLNHFTLGRTLHEDIRNLAGLGLDGLISAQNQRASYPTNLLMDVLARAMWDKRLSFRQIARESFADAFGVDGARVAAWFERMSRLWEPMFEGVYASGRDDRRIARGRRNLPRLAALVDEARPLVKRNLCRTDGAVRWSWRYFDSYLELLDLWLPAMKEYLDGSERVAESFATLFAWLWKQEKSLHPALDVYQFVKVLGWRVNEVKAEAGKTRVRQEWFGQ